MNAIAVVDQSLVNAYLERVNRFVEATMALQERFNQMLSGRTPETVQNNVNQTVAPVRPIQAEPVRQTAPVQQQAAPVTADDVNIDAMMNDILSGIDLDI